MASITTRDEATSDLLHAAAYLVEGIESVDEMSEAMNEVVPRFLGRAEVDVAAALADITIEPLARDRLLAVVAEKCIEANDDDYAMQLVEAIEEEALAAGAMERIALKMVERGDIDRALKIAQELSHPDAIFSAMATARYRKGDFDEALAFASQIAIPSSRASLSIAVARIAMESASVVEFENQIGNAERHAGETDLAEEAAGILLEVGNLCLEANRGDLAISKFEKVKEIAETLSWPHRDNLLGASASGLFASGSETLADMALDLVTDKSVIARTLSAFAANLRKDDDVSGAVEALDEAFLILDGQKDREIRDYRSNNSSWRGMAVQYALSGSIEGAVKVIGRIQDDEVRASSASQCTVVFADANRDADWRTSFELIRESLVESMTLIAIAEMYRKRNDTESAGKLIEECRSHLAMIEQPVASCSVETELFDFHCRAEDRDAASASLIQALRICFSMVNQSSQAIALARLSARADSHGFILNDSEKTALEELIR